ACSGMDGNLGRVDANRDAGSFGNVTEVLQQAIGDVDHRVREPGFRELVREGESKRREAPRRGRGRAAARRGFEHAPSGRVVAEAAGDGSRAAVAAELRTQPGEQLVLAVHQLIISRSLLSNEETSDSCCSTGSSRSCSSSFFCFLVSLVGISICTDTYWSPR